MGSQLDAQSAQFDERNLFLFLSLGLLSLGDRLERLLRHHASDPVHQRGLRPAPEPEPLAYLALGAIRMRDVIRRELRAAAAEALILDAADSSTETSAAIGDVLR